MGKQGKRIFPGILTIMLSLSVLLLLSLTPLAGKDNRDFLRARGDSIVDASGRKVLLRGLNVEFKDFMSVLNEQDIKKIAGFDANCIRLVIDYRDFEPTPFQYDKTSFSLLDRILDWSEKHGIYVILDMHLAQGIQNLHDFVVHREKEALFWRDEQFQERFFALWTQIAKRYADRKIVAGYDILNEGSPYSIDQYVMILQIAAKKIRSVDRNHMLVVEEALLPGWNKKLVLLDDPNVLYSIHFFHPPQFSFYATTTGRPITTYPGEMVTAGEMIARSRVTAPDGSSAWKTLELRTAPPQGAEIVLVQVSSGKSKGSVWFDDISLNIDGRLVDLPAPLVANNSFEIDYPGFNWEMEGRCVSRDHHIGKTGRSSLVFAGCEGPASAISSPIPAKKGKYTLTAWYKADNAPGEISISLSWHRKKVIEKIDRNVLKDQINYALAFKSQHAVPLYVGEFTAHVNPSDESVRRYLRDLLDIMEAEGLHWTFWEYYSVYRGVGLYTGNSPNLVNPAAWEVLREYMKR